MTKLEARVQSEEDDAQVMYVHSPWLEVGMASMLPTEHDYDGPVDIFEVRREHDKFVSESRRLVEKVLVLTDVLREETSREELERLARIRIKSFISTNEVDFVGAYISSLDKSELVRDIVLGAEISMGEGGSIVTHYSPSRVLGNLMFVRDSLLVTDKGAVISRMRNPRRSFEEEIVKVFLETLGITPIYRVIGDEKSGFVEGGDFIPYGNFAMIGISNRTDKEGALQLLQNGMMGYDHVALVHLNGNGNSLHLDHVCHPLGYRTSAVEASLTHGSMQPKVHLYKKSQGGYQEDLDIVFGDLLRVMEIGIVPYDDPSNAHGNFLHLSGGKNIGDRVEGQIRDGIQATGLPIEFVASTFSAIKDMKGKHHCSSQVLYRA